MTNDESNDEARMSNDEKMTKPEDHRTRVDDDSFWNDRKILVVREEAGGKRVYDLEERTARFGEAVIDFAKTVPQGPVTSRIISQLVGAGTSVGANYVEADDAVSKKEFLKCIGTLSKGSARDEAFSSHDCACRAGAEVASARTLDRGEGTAPHFLQDLEKQVRITKRE